MREKLGGGGERPARPQGRVPPGSALASILVFLASAGCKGEEPPRLSVLVLGTTQEPDTLDPVLTQRASSQEAIGLILRDLAVYDETWSVRPDLARGPPTLVAGSTSARFRVTLRPDLRWSDGRVVTAKDVVFGFAVASDPRVAVAGSSARKITAVRALDELTVEVQATSSVARVLLPRLLPVLPSHAYPAIPATRTPTQTGFLGLGRSPLANGPFRLVSWVPGVALSFERNPHWPGPRPAFDRVELRIFASEDALDVALRSRSVDAIGEASGLSLDRVVAAANALSATHALHLTDSGVWLHLDVRLDDAFGKDPRFRRALDLAIDRDALASLAYDGKASPSSSCFAPSALDLPPARFDRAAARALVADVVSDLGPIGPLRLQLASDSAASERAGTAIQSMLAEAGVPTRLEPVPFRLLMDAMRKHTQAPLALYAWRLPPDWDGAPILHSRGDRNFVGLADPELDALLERIDHTNAEDRKRLLTRVGQRYRELLPSIPLLVRQSASLRPRWLEGWKPTGTTTPVTWNAEEWRRAESR